VLLIAPQGPCLQGAQLSEPLVWPVTGCPVTRCRVDAKAKDAQLVKLAREEALSQLRVELASGRMVKMAQLRGASRCAPLAPR